MAKTENSLNPMSGMSKPRATKKLSRHHDSVAQRGIAGELGTGGQSADGTHKRLAATSPKKRKNSRRSESAIHTGTAGSEDVAAELRLSNQSAFAATASKKSVGRKAANVVPSIPTVPSTDRTKSGGKAKSRNVVNATDDVTRNAASKKTKKSVGHAQVVKATPASVSTEERGGHSSFETHPSIASAFTFPTEILQAYRIYKQVQSALVRITNQIKAIQKYDPHHGAILTLNEMLLAGKDPYKHTEKQIVASVRTLPVWKAWGKGVRGLAENSLGQLLGETGDLSNYSSVAKVWKRMGLAVVNGHRQQNWSATRKGFTKSENVEMAQQMGYKARRRSLMHVIGSNLIRAKNPYYRSVYDARKEYELERLPDKDPVTGKKNKSKKSHAHARALRYMEKRFLKDLWKQWRAISGMNANRTVPSTSKVAAD